MRGREVKLFRREERSKEKLSKFPRSLVFVAGFQVVMKVKFSFPPLVLISTSDVLNFGLKTSLRKLH